MTPTSQNSGTSVIQENSLYRPEVPAPGGHRGSTSAGSMEWKKWMSSEVSKTEKVKENPSPSTSYVNCALTATPSSFRSRHVRELAQIVPSEEDEILRTIEDADEMMREAAERKLGAQHKLAIERKHNAERSGGTKSKTNKLPLGTVQQNIVHLAPQNIPVLKPILKNRSVVSLIENIDPSATGSGVPILIPPPPPIPNRSPLRVVPPMPSKTSPRSIHTASTSGRGKSPNSTGKVPSFSGRNMLHKRNTSATTLRSVKSARSSKAETPAKLVKKPSKVACTPSNDDAELRGSSVSLRSRSISRPRTPGGDWSGTREVEICRTGDGDIYAKKEMEIRRAEDEDTYGVEGAGLMGPEGGQYMSGSTPGVGGGRVVSAEQIGSKAMVDIFLSGRRRRIASGSEDEEMVFL